MIWSPVGFADIDNNIGNIGLANSDLAPVGLAEELCFFVHVLLDLSPVDVPKQRADVGRAEHISK